MTRRLRTLFTSIIPIALFSVVFLASCGNNDSGTSMGSLQVRMHDAPIDSADEVNVSINRVEINETGSEDGWSTISTPDQTFNLLELTNGTYAVLGDTTLPTGTYQQIRLVLNETGHNVVVDGKSHNLKVPSGSQTGVKLNVEAEIEENIQYNLLLDFSAAQSVVKRGNQDSYLLKPVIHADNQAVTGAIAGTVDPLDSKPIVYAIANSDTLASTIADTSNGNFALVGLEEGTYEVSVNPRNDEYSINNLTGVEVTVGEVNSLGTVEVSSTSN